jgi:quinol monooxygenase YgiN
MDVTPGQTAAFLEAWRHTARPYFESPGCRGVRLFQSQAQPDHFVCLVHWDDAATHKRVRETEPAQQFLNAIWGFFAAEPEIDYYDEL